MNPNIRSVIYSFSSLNELSIMARLCKGERERITYIDGIGQNSLLKIDIKNIHFQEKRISDGKNVEAIFGSGLYQILFMA